MTQPRTRTITGLLLGGLAAAGMLTAAGLGSAAAAQASCVSAFGLSTSADCRSTIASVAIAIGPNTQAYADGLLGAAFTIGNSSGAQMNGFASVAINAGHDSYATAGASGVGEPQFLNAVIQIGGGNYVGTRGAFNTAINLGGTTNSVLAIAQDTGPAYGSVAINAFGTDNTVLAGPGPLAIAVSFLQASKLVDKQQPGININGFRFPPNSAAGTPAAAATTRRSTRHPAAAGVPKTSRPSAAATSRGLSADCGLARQQRWPESP